jgi:hypothetical protein
MLRPSPCGALGIDVRRGSDKRSVEVLPVEHVRHAGVAVRHAELVPGCVACCGDRVAHGDHRDVVKLVQRLHVPARTAPAADDAYCQSCHLPPLSLTINVEHFMV